MTNISNKDLRLFLDLVYSDLGILYDSKPTNEYIQLRLYELFAIKVPLERIRKLKPFRKIIYKKIIVFDKGKHRIKKILRKRSK